MDLKKFIRTYQVYFPAFQDLKFSLMRNYYKVFKIPYESDFKALEFFPNETKKLFVDVGVNRGMSIDSEFLFTSNIEVIGLEPNAVLYDKLLNVFKNNNKVKFINAGLGETEGEFNFYIPFYRGWMFDGLASLIKESPGEWLKDNLINYDESKLVLKETKIKIVALDSLKLKPYFVKLDIQGYELSALKGADATLKEHEPVLLIESPDTEIISLLSGYGYTPFSFNKYTFIKNNTDGLNTFFMTSAKAKDFEKYISG